MVDPAAAFDPLGAHFLSYRQKDGTALTNEVMWRLRAGGIPVWRDADDLLPGETDTRLREALSDGLAGGVLVITRDIVNSRVVREIEAPHLVELAEHSPFGLAVANAVLQRGKPDYGVPDRLLGRTDGKLGGFMQYAVTDSAEMLKLVKGVRTLRMQNVRDHVAAAGGWLEIDIQTRNLGSSTDRSGAALDVRVKPADSGRLPDRTGLEYFVDTAAGIPTAVTTAGANKVRFGGGAHLSVALALGTLLPATRIGTMEVTDQYGGVWAAAAPSFSAANGPLEVVEHTERADSTGRAVAVYLDLMPIRNDGAWHALLDELGDDLKAAVHVRPSSEDRFDPADAQVLAAQAASFVREAAYQNSAVQVRLVYAGPFPLAPLIGRLLNTVQTVLYEWDNTGDAARYVPALTSSPADMSSPLTVCLPE